MPLIARERIRTAERTKRQDFPNLSLIELSFSKKGCLSPAGLTASLPVHIEEKQVK